MPKKRRPHDELKPEVIAAARQVVMQGGPSAISARGLADMVGVSVGTIYNLFGHLDGVVQALNLESMSILHAELEAALAGIGPDATVETKLLALADAYFDYAIAAPHRWETLFRYHSEMPRGSDLETAQEGLFSILRHVAGGDVSDDALSALWAAVHGVVELAIAMRSRDPDGQNARRQTRLVVMAGLRGFASLREDGLL